MTSTTPMPKPSTTFVIVTFAVAIFVGALVIYLGIQGTLGGPIPLRRFVSPRNKPRCGWLPVPASANAAERPYHPNAGWIAALLVIAVIFGIGAFLWFSYHP